jgi:hypothetical protein
MAEYKVERVQPTVYLDSGGRPTRGYMIRVSLTKWNEIHDLEMPTLDPDKVREEIEALIALREELDKLSK